MPTITVRTARRSRPCGAYPCSRIIAPGQWYVRHVAFPGDDGHEEGTRPRVLSECWHCVDRRGDYVRHQYRVAAHTNGRVTVDGKPGEIVGFTGAYLLVLFDGVKHPSPAHPTWRVRYAASFT